LLRFYLLDQKGEPHLDLKSPFQSNLVSVQLAYQQQTPNNSLASTSGHAQEIRCHPMLNVSHYICISASVAAKKKIQDKFLAQAKYVGHDHS